MITFERDENNDIIIIIDDTYKFVLNTSKDGLTGLAFNKNTMRDDYNIIIPKGA